MAKPFEDHTKSGSFIDECHFSKTGFALWKWTPQGISYCTCQPKLRPESIDLKASLLCPPYPFCRTPDKCAGKGYCRNDPACNN